VPTFSAHTEGDDLPIINPGRNFIAGCTFVPDTSFSRGLYPTKIHRRSLGLLVSLR
jgi:hypothetical protein